jgi:bifunctional ADP-heptose synthase (sugar kinase/adenylyltransferase)
MISFQDSFRLILEQNNIPIVAMLDYRKGMLANPTLTQWIIKACDKRSLLTYVDSRSKDLLKFKGATIVKVNDKEFSFACGALNVSDPHSLLSKLNTEHLLITKGEEGAEACVQQKTTKGFDFYSYKPDISSFTNSPDVTGCGDVFDISFCYEWGIKNNTIKDSLIKSVEKASEYAYKPLKERIIN